MQNNIRRVRLSQGLSLEKVAKAVGTTKGQIQKLEKGERRLTLGWMTRLARALNVSVAELLPRGEEIVDDNAYDNEILQILGLLNEKDKRLLVQIASTFLKRPQPD